MDSLYELLKEMGISIQRAEADMAAYGESLFLRDYNEDGSAQTRDFSLPTGSSQKMPATTLKHHRPLGHKRVVIETEVEISLPEPLKEDSSPIKIRLKRGLRAKTSNMKLRVEYEMRDPTEGVSLLHETLLDKVHEVPMVELTPAKPIEEK